MPPCDDTQEAGRQVAWGRARTELLAARGEASSRIEEEPKRTLSLAVVAEGASTDESLSQAFESLRFGCARDQVRAAHGLDVGFRLEDCLAVSAGVPHGVEKTAVRAWLARRMPDAASVTVVTSKQLTLAAVLLASDPKATTYERQRDGRVRVQAFELHVTEHCNLRCANCCNMSPLVARRSHTVQEIAALCERMARVLVADVFKIMGGEPLLHPDVAGVLRAVRASGIGDRVRLFTNGLRLGRVPDEFWEALDELTISSYSSAPVRPAIMDMARERALRHGFVLNIKQVTEFSHVLSPAYIEDDQVVQRTYDNCWLRHRCLIVRGGKFYMCTRAAYAADFSERALHTPPPPDWHEERENDGIDLDAPELETKLEAYLNRTEPLAACRFCFGGDGATETHYQLTGEETRRGVLSRKLSVLARD